MEEQKGKVGIAFIQVKLAEQEREIAVCKTRLAAEQMKLAEMNLDLARMIEDAEKAKEQKVEPAKKA